MISIGKSNMSDFQSDLVGFSRDVEQYTTDLTASLQNAADDADSEEDFAQQIRNELDSVMNEFSIGYDYVDTQIGTLSLEEMKAALREQNRTFDDVPFDSDDIHEGGQRPDAVAGASVTDYKDPGVLMFQ